MSRAACASAVAEEPAAPREEGVPPPAWASLLAAVDGQRAGSEVGELNGKAKWEPSEKEPVSPGGREKADLEDAMAEEQVDSSQGLSIAWQILRSGGVDAADCKDGYSDGSKRKAMSGDELGLVATLSQDLPPWSSAGMSDLRGLPWARSAFSSLEGDEYEPLGTSLSQDLPPWVPLDRSAQRELPWGR